MKNKSAINLYSLLFSSLSTGVLGIFWTIYHDIKLVFVGMSLWQLMFSTGLFFLLNPKGEVRLKKSFQNALFCTSFSFFIAAILILISWFLKSSMGILSTSPMEIIGAYFIGTIFSLRKTFSHISQYHLYGYNFMDHIKVSFEGRPGEEIPIKDDSDADFQSLDLAPTDDQDLIKRQYLLLSRVYHPDKWQNRSEEEKEFANRKFQAIQEAYERIKKI